MNVITKNPHITRQSNFELLRIIAMFMVLVIHADFIALGAPTAQTFEQSPGSAFTQVLLESAGLCAVNIFVMISGWFGIKTSLKGFCNFMFQVLFFLTGAFIIMWALGRVTPSAGNLATILCMQNSCEWFVVAYAMLYILSPVLNAFLHSAEKHQLLLILLAFFAAQTFWGFVKSGDNFNSGYSTLSFCGLYLLAAYIRRYISTGYKYTGIVLYLAATATLTALLSLQCIGKLPLDWMLYTNPLIIASATGLIMQFGRIDLGRNRFINFVAASSFSVYLLHCNSFIFSPVFALMVRDFAKKWGGVEVGCLLIAIFILAVILDQPRKLLWNKIAKHINFTNLITI